MSDREPEDKIPMVDSELQKEREEEAREAREFKLNHPSIDELPSIDPIIGQRADLLSGRPEDSAYPGKNPPRPAPTKGAKIDD